MRPIPIACTLASNEAGTRFEEWQKFLKRHVVETVRTDHAVRLRLNDDAALAAIDLARREKACCAFFDFRLTLLPEAVWLEIDAAEEAASILDALVALRAS